MTDFDKLIKEKTEQAEYAYKPSAWRNFKRATGAASPLRYWIVGSVSAVVLGGVVATAVYLAPNRQLRNSADPRAETMADSMLLDVDSPVGNMDTVSFSPQVETAPVVVTSPKKDVKGDVAADAAFPHAQKSDTIKRTPGSSVRLGRPLVIDVDTIKDNAPTDEELRNGHSRLF